MKAYHFIKYNDTTSLDQLLTQTDHNTVLCFDFEDSIQDCLNPVNTAALKAKYRNYFKIVMDRCRRDIKNINIGIRLNPIDSPAYFLDLLAIAGLKQISTIFLPKISDPGQILKLQNDLQRNSISYLEIIPVIETKAGLNNLEEIVRNNSNRISSIAFGHCDYNFDIKQYPYFHQDAREYWTWIAKIFGLIKAYHVRLVNSPLLSLDNDAYFIHMLSILYSICGDHCGQITLTKKQTALCHSFSRNKTNSIPPKLSNRLDLGVPDFYEEIFINSFEKNCLEKGFAITDDRVLLSPQEYLSSLNYRSKRNFPDVHFTFVGGCFPVQGNVPFENLFHQLLKRKTEHLRDVKFNVNIIRYERLRNCIPKIASYNDHKPIDILAFSIRPEPFLRLIKLYYKYVDHSTDKVKWSLNLPVFDIVNPEKHDLLSLDTRFNPTVVKDSSIIRKTLININYILGSLIGNHTYALKKYVDLVNEVIAFSNRNNIRLYIIGPPMRTNTMMERFLSKRLDTFIRKSLSITQEHFVSGSDMMNTGENLFEKRGIYATEKYHELIVTRLLEKILPAIDKMATPDSGFPEAECDHGDRRKMSIFQRITSL